MSFRQEEGLSVRGGMCLTEVEALRKPLSCVFFMKVICRNCFYSCRAALAACTRAISHMEQEVSLAH